MKSDTPVTLAAARYSSREGALTGFDLVLAAHQEGTLDHTAIAVLTKDADGKLQVERHDTTAKHLAWGGAILGAAMVVVNPAIGAGMVAAAGRVPARARSSATSTTTSRRRTWKPSPPFSTPASPA